MSYELNSASIGGNLTADPDVRYTSGDAPTAIARYTLAVNRRAGDADYIRCVVFGKQAEYAEKYLKKGAPVLVTGCIRTGNYTSKDGTGVNTMEVVTDRQTTEKDGALNMNRVLLFGRLTRDPEVRYTQGESPVCVARYTLAVPRKYYSKRAGDSGSADFITFAQETRDFSHERNAPLFMRIFGIIFSNKYDIILLEKGFSPCSRH